MNDKTMASLHEKIHKQDASFQNIVKEKNAFASQIKAKEKEIHDVKFKLAAAIAKVRFSIILRCMTELTYRLKKLKKLQQHSMKSHPRLIYSQRKKPS